MSGTSDKDAALIAETRAGYEQGQAQARAKAQTKKQDATKPLASVSDNASELSWALLKAVFYELYHKGKPFREVLAKLGNKNPFTKGTAEWTYFEQIIKRGETVHCQDDCIHIFQAVRDLLPDRDVNADVNSLLSVSVLASNVSSIYPALLEKQARLRMMEICSEAISNGDSAVPFEVIAKQTQERLAALVTENLLLDDDITDFLDAQIPENRLVMDPVLREKDLAMVYAGRGVGKTWFNLSLAAAISTGRKCFDLWSVPEPRKVLYLDGEMSSMELQDRLRKIFNGIGARSEKGYFTLCAADRQAGAMPNLATAEGQAALDKLVERAEVVFVDNISCLASLDDENDAAAWQPVQRWLIDLRRRGKAVILVHHSGKGKDADQRGTSKREDILDLVLKLVRVEGKADACFDVVFTKNRHLKGKQAEAFRLELEQDGDAVQWLRHAASKTEIRKAENDNLREQALILRQQGKALREIASILGCGKDKARDLLNDK